MKKHEENKVIVLLKRTGINVNQANKTINASKTQTIGNKRWGKIDFLCHYCGYVFIWGDTYLVNQDNYNSSDKKKELREAKKASKQHKLTNKNNKKSVKR